MKPLGTITMYYPFLDRKTREVIEEIMDTASDYYNFVELLSDRVCMTEESDSLKYLAAIHAWRLSAVNSKRKLVEEFGEDPIILSWAAPHHAIKIDNLREMISEAIKVSDEDWLRIELLCLKIWCARYRVTVRHEEFWNQPLEQAESILSNQPELECFAALIQTVKSEMSFYDGHYDEAYSSHNQGIEFAKKYDDQFQIYQLLWTCSSWIKTWDVKRALALQEEAYTISRRFGSPQKIAEAMADMGRISECLGEYDFAISCYESSLETYVESEMELYRESVDTPSFGLSRVYSELGDGVSSLEWINRLIDLLGPSSEEISYLHSQRAEALILLKKYEEATKTIEISRRLALKSGTEGYIVLSDFAAAGLELEEGDPLTSIRILEQGLEYILKRPTSIYTNRFLIALAKAEIAANIDAAPTEISEKWLASLEKHAKERDLPGILMMHALLKSKYLISQGHKDQAIDVLENSLNEECETTSKTLYKRIQKKLTELRTL